MTLFKAKIRNDNLYPVYRGVNAILDECKLHIGTTGISIDEVDLANVCHVSAKIPLEVFESDSYHCMKNQTIGIDLTKYQEIIDKDLKHNPIIELKLMEPSGYTKPKLITRINHTEYKHTTLDPITIKRTVPTFEIKYLLELTVPIEFFIEGIKAVEKYSYTEVLIGVDFNKDDLVLFIRSNTDDFDGANTEMRLVDLQDSIRIGEKESPESILQSIHSMDYMTEIVKGLSAFNEISCGNVILKLNNDGPIEILIKDELLGLELKYLLAPRIYSDESGHSISIK